MGGGGVNVITFEIRDCPLITGRGGGATKRGGHVNKVLPLRKKRAGWGLNKLYPVLRGGGSKKFRTHDFPIL